MPRPSGFIAWDAEYLVILSILERTPADQAKSLSQRPGIQYATNISDLLHFQNRHGKIVNKKGIHFI